MNRTVRITLAVAIIACSLGAQQAAPHKQVVSADTQAALDRISAESLRGHLSFIASDALEGRNTPSRGLDIAAEYIAAQFRRAGLDAAGDDGYFQTANFALAETPMDTFELKLRAGAKTINVEKNHVSFSINKELTVSAPIFKVDHKDARAVAALKPRQVEGKVVIAEIPDYRREERSRLLELFRAQNEFTGKMTALKAALIISVDRISTTGSGGGPSRLIDPENRRTYIPPASVPMITVHDPRVIAAYDRMKPGPSNAVLSMRLPAQIEKPVKLRNVIGLLRGSDPGLKETYVLVTAHYDHLGTHPEVPGDNIFNGANDDGSGTVSVMELASALASLKQRPKRSIVFMTFFGEEKGLLGSRYYARHPVFPIDKTVANVNLEHVGRTDSNEGLQLANATLTGFDYSDLGATFKAAGELTGVTVYKHEVNSDAYFPRSDNQALADQGVPAHTLCTAFVFPDYHGVGDHWDKIDYANMEKVNRMVALAIVMVANNPEAPKWDEANPKTVRYVKAWREHHGK